MSRYKSLGTALEILEACRKLFGPEEEARSRADEVINDLRDMSKDVRYGAPWTDYLNENIAKALDSCPDLAGCASCRHRGEYMCMAMLKQDAANAIRSMGKRIAEFEAKAAEDREAI